MSYQLRQRLLDRCRAEIGVREHGANTGPRVMWYQAACDLARESKTGWAWCAAFVTRMIREWVYLEPEVQAALGLKTAAEIEAWRPRTAGAWDYKAWPARANKALKACGSAARMEVLPESAVLHAGDIIVFDRSHVGIVENDHGDVLWTIEGNTDASGGREGDGVYRRKRQRSEAQCFVRILP